MTTRLRRLFGSPTQNSNEGGRSLDFDTRDALAIFKPFNRTLEATDSIGQLNTGNTNDELNTDQDNDTIRPGSNGEFSLMLSELTSLDRRSSFLTSYYGSSAIPSLSNAQQSLAFAPSFRTVFPDFNAQKIGASPVPSGNRFQNARRLPTIEEGKLSVSIDFGTTFSGVAFGSSRIAGGHVRQILQWYGSFGYFRKIPTCLLYGEDGEVLAWGLEAKARFRSFLDPKFLRDGTVDLRLPILPPGKLPVEAIVDFFSCLWNYIKQHITREIGAVMHLADVWLIVPATWDAKGCEIVREAAIQAGLGTPSGTRAQDRNQDRLNIITRLSSYLMSYHRESEAAAVHCVYLTNLHQLRPSQNFMICDAGRETVNLTVYTILGSLEKLEIGEVCARSSADCGSHFLDFRFRDLVARILGKHPVHTDPQSLAHFQHAFEETDKLAFRGEEDAGTPFRFNCFNTEDQDDPAVGLINGELTIPGALLRSEVFDPIIFKILQFIDDQLALCNRPIHAMLFVGGFSENEYLFKSINQRFGTRIGLIDRPPDADTAACRGAAHYGITNRVLVSRIVVPKTYIMEATLPAEQEDWEKRPAYINISNTGVPLCKHRLRYLTRQGDILRKRQRVKATLCKFSRSSEDFTLTMVLYTSGSEHVIRYADEGGAAELSVICKWTIDLRLLPAFHENARIGSRSDFYTEFEVGLEIDSVEVRGVLLYHDEEWGRAVLEALD